MPILNRDREMSPYRYEALVKWIMKTQFITKILDISFKSLLLGSLLSLVTVLIVAVVYD